MRITELFTLLNAFEKAYKPIRIGVAFLGLTTSEDEGRTPTITGDKSSVEENDYLFHQARKAFMDDQTNLAAATRFLELVRLPCVGEKALEQKTEREKTEIKASHYVRSDILVFSPYLIQALEAYVTGLRTFPAQFDASNVNTEMQAFCTELANMFHERKHSSTTVEKAIADATQELAGKAEETLTVKSFLAMKQGSRIFDVNGMPKPKKHILPDGREIKESYSSFFVYQVTLTGDALQKELKNYFIKHFTPTMLDVFKRCYRNTSLQHDPAVASTSSTSTKRKMDDQGAAVSAKKR